MYFERKRINGFHRYAIMQAGKLIAITDSRAEVEHIMAQGGWTQGSIARASESVVTQARGMAASMPA
ncbi:MAG: hypothetical protein MO853_13860 [Candidatus Protistobacter heckmanni]|nr:hypothetical protein [Candidatus Protistobacter heckmanni]